MKDLRSRFGLHTLPFTKEIAVENFFALPMFDQALEGLINTIEYRMSAVIIAPARDISPAGRGRNLERGINESVFLSCT